VKALRQFFRTPKGLLTIVLVLLVAIAAPSEGIARALPEVLAAALAGAIVDVPILRWRSGEWEFPSGAILTGMLVAMVLTSHEPWWVVAVTTVVGVLSKYAARTKSANVFNPAALAIVATFYVFNTGQSWWGAMPNAPAITLAVLFAAGIFIADRVNKLPLVVAFLGVYYLLFTLTAFFGDPRIVAEIYRAPDLQAVLFFAFFILTDPPTSPVRHKPQIICGVLVAVVSYGVFELVGAVYYLLAGVLVGNVWEAWRRMRLARA
jgi:Na+-translocating ferredoxin:NAD+ oxidoreductase RnfD subunit